MARQNWLGPFEPQDDLHTPPRDTQPQQLGESSADHPRPIYPRQRIFNPDFKVAGPQPPPRGYVAHPYQQSSFPPQFHPPLPCYCPNWPGQYQVPCDHVRPQPDLEPRRDSNRVESPTQSVPMEQPKWEVPSSSSPNQETRSFEIGDTQGFVDFLEHNLYKIQQLSIKAILKLWIKAVEPKKQSHHPYKSKNGSRKPGWWPDDVPHQEPDHGDKADRKKLFIHFIMMPETWPKDDGLPEDKEDPNFSKKPLKCRELRLQPGNWINFLEDQIKTMDLKFENEDDQKVEHRKRYLKEIFYAARIRMDWLDDGVDGTDMFNYVFEKKSSRRERKRRIAEESDDQTVEDPVGAEAGSTRKKRKSRASPCKALTDETLPSPAGTATMSTTGSSGISSPALPSPAAGRYAAQPIPPSVDPGNPIVMPATQPIHPTALPLGASIEETPMADAKPVGEMTSYFPYGGFSCPAPGMPASASVTDCSMYTRIPTTCYPTFTGLYTPSSSPGATYSEGVPVVHPMYSGAQFDPNHVPTSNLPIHALPNAGYGYSVDEYNARLQMNLRICEMNE